MNTRPWSAGAASRRLVGLLVLAALAACGGDRGEAPGKGEKGKAGDEAVREGGTAVIAELADMAQPLPPIYNTQLDGDLMDVMYMALTRGAWRDGRLVYLLSDQSPMALAWHYEYVGPDSAALRYRMRSGLRWSDGQPITAHDVVWTYQVVKDPRTASPRQDHTAHLDSVVAENDSTVVFYFDRRYPEMLFYSGLNIAPRHAYRDANLADLRNHPRLRNPGNGNLVVSGAFMVGQWQPGQRVVLVPNPHFPVRPHLEQIVIRVIPETTTRLVELQNGTVDFTRPIPTDQVPGLRQRAPQVRFEREEKRTYDYIGYNPRGYPPFADPEIRAALGLALDVRAIIASLQMQEFAVPAGGPYAPIFRDLYDPREMAPLPYDTARARQILEAKGWRDSDGDGIRDQGGRPFRFTLMTNSANQRRADVAQIVQQMWRRIGVQADLQQSETNTMFARLEEKDFQAVLAGWSVGLSADLGALWNRDSELNFVSYDNPRTFALFQQAREATTEAQSNALWKQAAAQIVADRPYTWLYYLDGVVGVRDRLRGVRVDTYGAYQNVWEWWVADAPGRGAPDSAKTTTKG
ncbi:MAG TPA: ABC transporter substrate-binding protein [Longimicrobium sp.]|nr:ABC transporter substrate-binding protein [Longimicrobium sp.]